MAALLDCSYATCVYVCGCFVYICMPLDMGQAGQFHYTYNSREIYNIGCAPPFLQFAQVLYYRRVCARWHSGRRRRRRWCGFQMSSSAKFLACLHYGVDFSTSTFDQPIEILRSLCVWSGFETSSVCFQLHLNILFSYHSTMCCFNQRVILQLVAYFTLCVCVFILYECFLFANYVCAAKITKLKHITSKNYIFNLLECAAVIREIVFKW